MTSESANFQAYLAAGCAIFPGAAERRSRAPRDKLPRVSPATRGAPVIERPQKAAGAPAVAVDLSMYRHTRRDVFGSRRSIQRFVERHCDELLTAGALVSDDGRLTVYPALFDEVVEAVGRHPSSARRLREARASSQ